ncbi:hypothetical protein PV379_04185 [Streptomyces caniscabiei]|uniref:hypothetical protein n=1 Tax=Streptomyces caniscabiei TaxID=2746961 RepID=UPI0029A09294|nr:hypothetical protein [Streptomyces caniscabiei]MDX2776536.1 hypothetical protein [Streptomyces caniscabiei]
MSFMVAFAIIVAALFALPFFTKRRFGLPGLALAAGAMLAALWVGDVTPLIAQAGVVIVQPPLESIVTVVLTLLPAVLLLPTSPGASSSLQRLGGSVAFALLAVALLLPAIHSALVIDQTGMPVYEFFAQNRAAIVTIGLVAALFDILMKKRAKSAKH